MSENFHIAHNAHEQFSKAQWKALVSRFQHFLHPDKDKLLSFNDVKDILRPKHQIYRGMRSVPVNLIIGSEGRYQDFNKCFAPKTHNTRQRWESIAGASMRDIILPAVQLYEIGGVYFVRDGNHRVSVAAAQGVMEIDAEVTSLESEIKIKPDFTIAELRDAVIKYEKRIFYDETFFGDLTDYWDLDFSRTGRYDVIYNHILAHKYFINQGKDEEIPFCDALVSWYKNVYCPVMKIVDEEHIYARFPRRKGGDFYVWLVKRWDLLKQEFGDEFSLEDAAKSGKITQDGAPSDENIP
ncbi:MAG: transcriptional regulator [Spirochaetaceae bacterium]|jgi:hypothetical protein|nr:transcriptional regulator [Spirochaetaceae bacterium]